MPAIWNSAIYLCGGNRNSSIEVFDGMKIRLLDFSLPEKGTAITCVQVDCLLIMTWSNYVRLSGQAAGVKGTVKKRKFNTCRAYSIPVLWNGIVSMQAATGLS